MMPRPSRVIADGSGNPCRCWVWTVGFHRKAGANAGWKGNQPSVDLILTEGRWFSMPPGPRHLTTLENPKWKMR